MAKTDAMGREEATDDLDDPYRDWPIKPFSIKHIFRNENNWCPTTPPKKDCEDDCLKDHRGIEWKDDNFMGELLFHGGWKGYQSYRRTKVPHGKSGMQCTYDGEQLVDSGKHQGTFDYRVPDYSNSEHYDYDVAPHFKNDNYADGITRKY